MSLTGKSGSGWHESRRISSHLRYLSSGESTKPDIQDVVLAYTNRDSTRNDIKMKIVFFLGGICSQFPSISNTIPWHPKTMELWCVSLFRWDPPNQSALVSRVRWSNRNAYGYTPEISGSCWCYIAISLWSISVYIYIYYIICVCVYSLCIHNYIFCQLKLEMVWQDPDIRQMNHYDAWLWDDVSQLNLTGVGP